MSYISRAKELVKLIRRFDAVEATNAELATLGQAFLYHPRSNEIWNTILTENSLVVNPDNSSVKDDIGTLSGNPKVFTPASAAMKNAQLANLFRRNYRSYTVDVLVAHELRITNAPAEPIKTARASIISSAQTAAGVVMGTDGNDPES